MEGLILIQSVDTPSVGDMQETWADPPQGPPSRERISCHHKQTHQQ